MGPASRIMALWFIVASPLILEGVEGCSREEAVMLSFIQSMPTFNLFLHIEEGQDLGILGCLLARGVPFSYFSEPWLWGREVENGYWERSQHAVIGSPSWIQSHLRKAMNRMGEGQMNINCWMRPLWERAHKYSYFLMIYRQGESVPNSTPQSDAQHFNLQRHLAELNTFIEDNLNILAVFHNENSNRTSYPAACRVDGELGSRLVYCGDYKEGRTSYLHPLWPGPMKDFFGRTTKIAVLSKPTVFAYKNPDDGISEASGWMAEISRWIFSSLNASVEMVPSAGFGRLLDSGNWTGMVGALYRKEAELGPLDFSPAWVRNQYIEFSTPQSTDYVVVLSKAPAVVLRPFLLLQIFSPLMWCLLLLSAVGSGVIAGITAKIQAKYFSTDDVTAEPSSLMTHLGRYSALICGQHLIQSSRWLPKASATRIVCAFAFANAFLVYSIYRSSVIAFLAIPFRSEPIRTLEDIFESGTTPATRINAVVHAHAMAAEKGTAMNTMGEKMKLFTGAEISSWDFFRRVSDGDFSLVDTLTTALGRARKFEKNGEECKFYLSNIPVRFDLDVVALRRNTPLKPMVDKMIERLRSFGIVEELKKRAYSLPCYNVARANDIAPLSLIQTQSAFIVLGVGLILGWLSFSVEILAGMIRSH